MSSKNKISPNSSTSTNDKYMIIVNKINGVVQILDKQSTLLKEQNATISRFGTKFSVLESAIAGLRSDYAMLKNEIRVTASRLDKSLKRTDSYLEEKELNVAMPNSNSNRGSKKVVNIQVIKHKNQGIKANH
nr:uncharacterized protein LOC111421643 isoform X1 [Onthophagus taurus]